MSFIQAVWLQAEFRLRGLWNWRSLLYGELIQPVVYLAFLAAGIQKLIDQVPVGPGLTIPYLAYVFSGLLGLLAARFWTSAMSSVANDRRWGTYALKRLNGMSPIQYLCGIVLVGVILFLFQSVLLAGLALMLGLRFSLLGFAMSLLTGVGVAAFWAGIGAAIASFVQNYERRDMIISLGWLPILFSAPIFFPLGQVPAYLQVLSQINPLTYQVMAMRKALFGVFGGVELLVVCGMLVVGVGIGLWGIRRAELVSTEW